MGRVRAAVLLQERLGVAVIGDHERHAAGAVPSEQYEEQRREIFAALGFDPPSGG